MLTSLMYMAPVVAKQQVYYCMGLLMRRLQPASCKNAGFLAQV
jgi:hypothetical protein